MTQNKSPQLPNNSNQHTFQITPPKTTSQVSIICHRPIELWNTDEACHEKISPGQERETIANTDAGGTDLGTT